MSRDQNRLARRSPDRIPERPSSHRRSIVRRSRPLELILQCTPADRERILPALQEFARQHSLPAAVVNAADLALEEHVTNILNYAHPDSTSATHTIHIRFAAGNGQLQVEIEDDGRPFNPLDLPPVDTSLPLEEKPVGGLGIHLIRTLMDEVTYERLAGKNILRLRKRIA